MNFAGNLHVAFQAKVPNNFFYARIIKITKDKPSLENIFKLKICTNMWCSAVHEKNTPFSFAIME